MNSNRNSRSFHLGGTWPRVGIVFVAVGVLPALAVAQSIDLARTRPTFDRWMYPFNSTPGAETAASAFGAIRQAGFDDRDAQVLLAFDTAPTIPVGRPIDEYRIVSARVHATMSADARVRYDESWDSVASLYATDDPAYRPDGDLGRPTELFAVGFRNGQSAATFGESTAFSTQPTFPPQEGIRSAFAGVYDDAGIATDVSRQVRQRFEATPMGIGRNVSLTPGELIAAGTELTFEIDLCAPGAAVYVQRGLAAGRVLFMVTTLEPTSGGPGGGTGDPTYPAFFMKENPLCDTLPYAARFEMRVEVRRLADVDGDGGVTIDDLLLYLEAYASGVVAGDVNYDCGVTIDDLLVYLEAYARG